MKINDIINKRYILYGISIILTRGLELSVLFFAAHFLSKAAYGNLEYYKKIIEVGSSFLAFGLPALILSYTTNKQNKNYFYVLSVLFSSAFALLIAIFLYFFHQQILLIPLLFYAVFFIGGITQNYILVRWNSNLVSIYKIIISLLFYGLVYVLIRYYQVSAYAYVYPAYVLLLPAVLFVIWLIYNEYIKLRILKKYARLFFRLLPSSLTLVVSNFANLMFLYTDIFIIKFLSQNPSVEIADYSFGLNIANILLIIPVTLVQVDVEKLKLDNLYLKILVKKILLLISLASLVLIIFYFVITQNFYTKFQNTLILFLIILFAKIFQSLTIAEGTSFLIQKKYSENLLINLSALSLNIFLSYLLYAKFGLYGVAIASVISLSLRFLVLLKLNRKIIMKKNK